MVTVMPRTPATAHSMCGLSAGGAEWTCSTPRTVTRPPCQRMRCVFPNDLIARRRPVAIHLGAGTRSHCAALPSRVLALPPARRGVSRAELGRPGQDHPPGSVPLTSRNGAVVAGAVARAIGHPAGGGGERADTRRREPVTGVEDLGPVQVRPA